MIADVGFKVWTTFMNVEMTAITTFFYDNEIVETDNGAYGEFLGNGLIRWISGDWSTATNITGADSGCVADIVGVDSPSYNIGDYAIWGGKYWLNYSGHVGYSVNKYTLNSHSWEQVVDSNLYNEVLDEIKYDLTNNKIISRKDEFGNEVSGTALTFAGLIDSGFGNPIKDFQWGNADSNLIYYGVGVKSNKIIDSYFDCINSLARGITFNELQDGSYFANNNYSNNSIISGNKINRFSFVNLVTTAFDSVIAGLSLDRYSNISECKLESSTMRDFELKDSIIIGNILKNSTYNFFYSENSTISNFNSEDFDFTEAKIFNSRLLASADKISNCSMINFEAQGFNHNNNGLNFSTSNILFSDGFKTLFDLPNGTQALRYFNNQGVLVIGDFNI